MIVFVTGATGALGRPTVSQLLAAGHTVRALARTDRSAAVIAAAGAEPVPGNLIRSGPWLAQVTSSDAVIHLATHIPPARKARRRGAWAQNNRIRAEGTKLLVNAALAGQVEWVIYPSLTMLYTDGSDRVLAAGTEGTTEQPTSILASTLTAEAEVRRFTEAGRAGVVLRLGNIYGPSGAGPAGAGRSAPDPVIAMARRGISAFVGRPEAYQALLWDEDAASALVAALAAPAGTYDVVDDEPLTRAELAEVLSEVVGRPVKPMPVWFTRGLLRAGAAHMLRSQRVSHAAYTEATGWQPTVRSAREGLPRLRSS